MANKINLFHVYKVELLEIMKQEKSKFFIFILNVLPSFDTTYQITRVKQEAAKSSSTDKSKIWM